DYFCQVWDYISDHPDF
nr:immunoglobulin light chain junction region [Macaca mulatta]